MKLDRIFPLIVTDAVEESVKYYTTHFAFKAVVEMGWYYQLRHPDGAEIALMLPNHESQPPLFHPVKTDTVLSFETPDVEAMYRSLKEQGVEIALDLVTEEWGQIHFAVKDPSGVIIDVSKFTTG